MKNAWLITWESDRPINNDQKIIHSFSARRSQKYIADFVEQFYLMTSVSAGDAIYYMNRKNKIPSNKTIFLNISA